MQVVNLDLKESDALKLFCPVTGIDVFSDEGIAKAQDNLEIVVDWENEEEPIHAKKNVLSDYLKLSEDDNYSFDNPTDVLLHLFKETGDNYVMFVVKSWTIPGVTNFVFKYE